MPSIPLTSKQMSMQALQLLNESVLNGPLRKWVVVLGDEPRVRLAADQNRVERKSYNIPDTYFTYAKDELDAYRRARKMEAKNNGTDHD
jgi:hypothetical protein